jgi:hypothetical protein
MSIGTVMFIMCANLDGRVIYRYATAYEVKGQDLVAGIEGSQLSCDA